jgi:hypothetical protein
MTERAGTSYMREATRSKPMTTALLSTLRLRPSSRVHRGLAISPSGTREIVTSKGRERRTLQSALCSNYSTMRCYHWCEIEFVCKIDQINRGNVSTKLVLFLFWLLFWTYPYCTDTAPSYHPCNLHGLHTLPLSDPL